jgi:hypothetical protein
MSRVPPRGGDGRTAILTAVPSNKELKLTRPGKIGASQLNSTR